MKSYNHLYETMLTSTNLRLAVKQSKHSRRIRKLIKQRHLSDDSLAIEAKEWIENFENAHHKPLQIYDGIGQKVRFIVVPTLEELVVQHAIVEALKPMLTKGMYEHSYASLPKRGAHKARKVMEKWIRHDSKNTKYCLKMDIRKFFDSIPHDILKQKLSKKIHDPKMLALLFEILSVVDVGLPFGFYSSQWLSNWYLQDLDHYIKEDLGAVYYMRYMDDMVIFGNNKRKLHKMREAIEKFLNDMLGLNLKDNWQVFRFDSGPHGRALDFMGFQFFRNRVTLRRSIMLKASRKAGRIRSKPKPTVYDYRQMMSYFGWISWTNTYNFYLKWIKSVVSFRHMRKAVSRYSLYEEKNVYQRLATIYH